MIPQGIIVHCSDSLFGCRNIIDIWHRERGWDGIGYHFVINNGHIDKDRYVSSMDGSIEVGRSISQSGAHARGYNDYIGICLIGKSTFTKSQFVSLSSLIKDLCLMYRIESEYILGHYEVSAKTCPNFDMKLFKKLHVFNTSTRQ